MSKRQEPHGTCPDPCGFLYCIVRPRAYLPSLSITSRIFLLSVAGLTLLSL